MADSIERIADDLSSWLRQPFVSLTAMRVMDVQEFITRLRALSPAGGGALAEAERDAARFRWAVASKQFQYWLDADSEEEARKAIDAALAPKPEGEL